jgi:hypothetical protein
MAHNAEHAAAQQWLVVGHGSVGSFLATRLVRHGHTVRVVDPNPRVPLPAGVELANAGDDSLRFDHVTSCVPPDVAETVPRLVAAWMQPDTFFFDWNTLNPSLKARISEAAAATVVDVALLDSLDTSVELPSLAVSGSRAAKAAEILGGLGFTVAIAGDEVGQAAELKYLRSIFMKTLEALVLEHASLSSGRDTHSIVRDSIANNLGAEFGEFMDLLLRTNRVHAERRSRELADAVAMFAVDGARPELAAAGIDVLRRSAQAWRDPSAPPVGSDPLELATYLHHALWHQTAST